MTEIEKKALALVNEVREGRPYTIDEAKREYGWCFQAVCRAIEQHEAFRQEVSDAAEAVVYSNVDYPAAWGELASFIIAKPDEATAGLALAVEETLELVIGDEMPNASAPPLQPVASRSWRTSDDPHRDSAEADEGAEGGGSA